MNPQRRGRALPRITSFAKHHWLRSLGHGTVLVTFILTVALSLSGNARDLDPANLSQDSEARTKAQRYEILRERVLNEPLPALTDRMFPELLILGRRFGGSLWISSFLEDPANPRTLDTNFAHWNLAARASLLLSYAKLVTRGDTQRQFDERVRSALAKEDARIAQIVSSGRYAASWQPFVVAYRKLVNTAESLVPAGDTSLSDRKSLDIVPRLAREQGMYQLVRELQIDPGDVANEMLRLVSEWRASHGLPNEGTDHGLNMFYVCDSTVRVHTWHSLAPAFFRAWEVADKKLNDPQALLVMTMFDGISKDIKNWVVAHPDASSDTRDRALNEMAKSRGLYSLLEK